MLATATRQPGAHPAHPAEGLSCQWVCGAVQAWMAESWGERPSRKFSWPSFLTLGEWCRGGNHFKYLKHLVPVYPLLPSSGRVLKINFALSFRAPKIPECVSVLKALGRVNDWLEVSWTCFPQVSCLHTSVFIFPPSFSG